MQNHQKRKIRLWPGTGGAAPRAVLSSVCRRGTDRVKGGAARRSSGPLTGSGSGGRAPGPSYLLSPVKTPNGGGGGGQRAA